MIAKNILELIGNTPLVQFNNVYNKPKLKMYIKMEKFNVSESVKDRIAKYMIEHAEKNRQLNKNKILIEPTSRNTGIGLSLVCRIKGCQQVIVMPETMTLERRKILKCLWRQNYSKSRIKRNGWC